MNGYNLVDKYEIHPDNYISRAPPFISNLLASLSKNIILLKPFISYSKIHIVFQLQYPNLTTETLSSLEAS